VTSPRPQGAPVRDGALIVTAAHLYYVEDRSQEEVAKQLGVSLSTVSRLLAEARRSGVVRARGQGSAAG
jgi:DNA-binding transcriptional regulator LsrR (DeoR family)